MSDFITVMQFDDEDKVACKQFFRGQNSEVESKGYGMPMLFHFEEIPVSSLMDLSNILCELEHENRKFIIHGKAKSNGVGPIRRKNTEFDAIPHQWICLDIDKWEIPDSIDPTDPDDPEFPLRWALSKLPVSFRNTTCHFQFSSSYLLTSLDYLKVHLWFWLDRPVELEEIKAHIKQHNQMEPEYQLDISLYSLVQPIYTSEPNLKDGILFPLPYRSGIISGKSDVVIFPHHQKRFVSVPAKQKRISTPRSRKQQSMEEDCDLPFDFEQCLALIGDEDGKMGFHSPLRRAVYVLACTDPYCDWERMKERIREAIRLADKSKHDPCAIERYKSDDYLDEDWKRSQEKANKVLRKKNSRLILGIKPSAPLHEITLDEAALQIQEAIHEWFAGEAPLLINATPGTGKSRLVLDFLKSKLDTGEIKTFWYLTPTLSLAESLSQRFQGQSIVIRGRTQDQSSTENEKMCLNPEVVNKKMNRNTPIYTTYCNNKTMETRCPFFDSCPYLNQFKQAQNQQGIFMSHQYAILSQRFEFGLPDPDVVIVDENILSVFVEQKRIVVKRFLRDLGKFQEVGRIIVEALRQKISPIPLLEQHGHDLPTIKKIIKKLKKNSGNKREGSYNPSLLVLQCLVHELERVPTREALYGIYLKENVKIRSPKKGSRVDDVLYLQYRLQSKIPKPAKLLLLDGYANECLLKPIFNGLNHVSITVRHNAHVYQTFGFTASEYALLRSREEAESHRTELNQFLERLQRTFSSGLVVTYKELEKHLSIHEHWHVNHFNAIRGLNTYENVECCVIIGRLHPPVAKVERFVRGLFYDQPKPLALIASQEENYPNQVRGLYLENEENYGIFNPIHPDPICQSYLEMVRENEILQSIGRIRGIRANQPKWIFILNEIVLPLSLSGCCLYRNLVNTDALISLLGKHGGVLPLDSHWLRNQVEEEVSADAIRKRIQRIRESNEWEVRGTTVQTNDPDQLVMALSKSSLIYAQTYKYRIEGGRWNSCLTFHDADQTKDCLEKIFDHKILLKSGNN